MSSITVYTFENEAGPFGSFSTQDADKAQTHGQHHGLKVIANEYTFEDSEPAWDFTPTDRRSRLHVALAIRDHEESMTADRCECGDSGYLLNQEYGNAEIPEGWTPVQACDLCKRFAGDETAAREAAEIHGIEVRFFDAEPDDESDDDEPGDWAINDGGPK